jgi:hypothetical protein
MGAKCCGKAAEGHGCGCGTMGAEGDYDTAYFVIDNSGSTSELAGGHFDQFQGAALKAIDRTRGIKKFIIVPMNGSTQKEAFDKKTAKEIVKNLIPMFLPMPQKEAHSTQIRLLSKNPIGFPMVTDEPSANKISLSTYPHFMQIQSVHLHLHLMRALQAKMGQVQTQQTLLLKQGRDTAHKKPI